MFGFVFFIAMYLIGNYISTALALPIPGAIVGLVFVLCMLIARGQVDAPLKESADLFLRYLALMLVPIGVGVVKLIDPAPVGIWQLVIVLVLALILGAVLTAKIMQGLLALRKPQFLAPTSQPENSIQPE
jgi:holin-like protein